MEPSAAGLGGPAPVPNIMATLSSLADTLHLSSANTAAGEHVSAPPASSDVDVSGMLESLSAAVPALGGASAPTANTNSSVLPLSPVARGPSGSLSGLGPQLLQLQEQLQVSHDPEHHAKHRSAAAAIAAALQRSAPQEDVAPAAPDFTLLSETVSESLHKHSHTQEPARKTSPVPPITPPVSEATAAPSMKPRMDAPDPNRAPPGHLDTSRMVNAQPRPPPPPPPNTHQPLIHHVHQHEVRMPLATASGTGLRGTPSRPPPDSIPQLTVGVHLRPGTSAQASGPRPPKPPVRPTPQPPGRPMAPQQSRPAAPPPGRPAQPPPRPPQHRGPSARPDAPQALAAARPKGTHGGSRLSEKDSTSVPDGGAKSAESQQARSVVHPHNPLKRVSVATAQAMKTTEQPPKAGTGSTGGPVPNSMHRLAAAKASLERKKLSQASGSSDVDPKKAVASDNGGDFTRATPQGSYGTAVPAAPSGSALHSSPATVTEKAAASTQPAASEGVAGQAVGVGRATSGEGSPVAFHAAKFNVRYGEKRPYQPTPRQLEDRPASKRPRQVSELKGRPDVQRVAGNKPGLSEGPARPVKGTPQWPVRNVRAGGKPATSDAKNWHKTAMGGSEGYGSRHREQPDSSRALPKAKMKRSGQAVFNRAEPRQPAARRSEPSAVDASSDDDDGAALADIRLARSRQTDVVPDSGFAAPAPKPRDGRTHALSAAAVPAAAAAQRRPVARSPPRVAVSPSPQKARYGGSGAMLDAARPPGKAHRQAERTPSLPTSTAAPFVSPMVRREERAKVVGTGRQHVARIGAQAELPEAAPPSRKAAGTAPRGENRSRRTVTHDVEVQTEAPDVRDSSIQTTQLWGRSSACQTEAPPPPSSPVEARLRQTMSISVQCNMSGAAGGHAAASGVESQGEDGRSTAIQAAQRAVEALQRVHELLSPQQQQVLAHHEEAILGLLSDLSRTAEEAALEVHGSGGQMWIDGADDLEEAEAREGSEHGNGSDAEASDRGWEEVGVEPQAEDNTYAAPLSDVESGGALEQDQETGYDDLESPRLEQSHAFDVAACSPDEVPLQGGLSREDSPDEVPVAPVYDEGNAQESDDAAPLTQSVQPDQEHMHGGDAMQRRPGVGVQSEGSSDASASADEDTVQVVRAAILSRLRKLLPKADLSVATAKSVRARLEISLRRDLRQYMAFIKEAINEFLADPDAFAVEYAEETALAARLNQPALAAAPMRNGAADRSRMGGHGGRNADGRPRMASWQGDVGASTRVREGASVVEGGSSPAPNLVGRLNGSVSVVPKRKGPAMLYCQANKSAKERFRTSMTPEQLREAKAAARAVLD